MNFVSVDEYRVCKKFLCSKGLMRKSCGNDNTTFDWYANGYVEGQWFVRERWTRDGLEMYIVSKVKFDTKDPSKVHAYMASPIKAAWQLTDGIKHADAIYRDAMKYASNFIKEKKVEEIIECAKGYEV